ncbi:hypothetical protein GF326_01650 [Candidatus Bathyarchaeota archaeon]|nr:hypothetical protein [Candidatus Bathyarchaeota archaeon]
MVKSYVRIYGPPLLKAIRKLEGVAVDLSNKTEIKFSHKCVPYPTRLQSDKNDWNSYLQNLQKTYKDCYEPEKIISEASMTLGDYDFMFEWSSKPTLQQIEELIDQVDKALGEVGVLYTLTTE